MSFTTTTTKHRRYQFVAQILAGLLILYDARNGQILKSAFGDVGIVWLFVWTWGIFGMLGVVSIGAMLKPFYSAGGKVWVEGGREQFAHAGGYSVSFYGTLLIEAIVIFVYPYIRQYGIIFFNSGVTIAIISFILSALICGWLAEIIFRRI